MHISIGRCFTAFLLVFLLWEIPVSASNVFFRDVPEDCWALEEIEKSAAYGLFLGDGLGNFGLGQATTRASCAAVLCRLMDWEMVTPAEGSFEDNRSPTAWYYSAIETAFANGALTEQNSLCRPDDFITREELTVMLMRAFGYTALAGTVDMQSPFFDLRTNVGYISLAYHMGLIRGTDAKYFSPRNFATREESAVIFLRAYTKLHTDIVTKEIKEVPEGVPLAESMVGRSGSLPLSPRASLENVMKAALSNKNGKVAIQVTPYAQTVINGVISEGENLSQRDFKKLWNDAKTIFRRSSHYGSSYLVVDMEENNTLRVVWYESEEDIAEKKQLCQLLDVKELYLLQER